MTAKEYLRQVYLLKVRCRGLEHKLTEMKAAATGTGSPSDMSRDRVQTSINPDKMADMVAGWVDVEDQLINTIDQYTRLSCKILTEIQQLTDPRYIELLTLRYIDCMTFDEIAIAMDMSTRHVVRLHGWALQAFSRDVLECHV